MFHLVWTIILWRHCQILWMRKSFVYSWKKLSYLVAPCSLPSWPILKLFTASLSILGGRKSPYQIKFSDFFFTECYYCCLFRDSSHNVPTHLLYSIQEASEIFLWHEWLSFLNYKMNSNSSLNLSLCIDKISCSPPMQRILFWILLLLPTNAWCRRLKPRHVCGLTSRLLESSLIWKWRWIRIQIEALNSEFSWALVSLSDHHLYNTYYANEIPN